jgi:hypothetical protein
MRIFMSFLRILFGVSLGIGYFAGIMYLPRPFSSILASLMFWLASAWFFYGVFRALRTGKIGINARTKFVVYERCSFEFWFYVLLFSFMGVLAFVFTLCLLFPSTFTFLQK